MTPHEILGVAPGATAAEIKSAYRKLAMEHHPDKHGGSKEAEAKFQEIAGAYEALTKPQPEPGPRPGFGGFGFDPFADMMDQIRRQQMMRNRDQVLNIGISLRQAYDGCEVNIELDNGSGTVTIAVPAGIDHGQRIRLEGKGETRVPDAPPGNLYVVVHVADDPVYRRVGEHLVREVEVDVADAILGTEMVLDTMAGDINLSIPAGIQHGTTLRVTGRGMPMVNSERIGDMHVVVTISIPAPDSLTDEEKTLIKQFRELRTATA